MQSSGDVAQAVEPGPRVVGDAVTWGFADPEHELAGVRLVQELGVPGDLLDFRRVPGGWALTLEAPAVLRMEYRLELRADSGERQEICDPANPLRAPGAFGEKSVLELPGYVRPDWLATPATGTYDDLAFPAGELGGEIHVRVWTPAGASGKLPMIVAHDGPEYDRLAQLTTFAAAKLPPLRVALVAPGDRNRWYSANPAYAEAMATTVLPALAELTEGRPIGLGVSLGALAMTHLHRTYPDTFAGLFLQSGSFFTPELDPQERDFSGFEPVTTFVAGLDEGARPIPVTITCGTVEGNLANNRRLADLLRAQGYPVTLVEVPDAHNFVAWRDALDPALPELINAVLTRQ